MVPFIFKRVDDQKFHLQLVNMAENIADRLSIPIYHVKMENDTAGIEIDITSYYYFPLQECC